MRRFQTDLGRLLLVPLALVAALSGAASAVLGTCGPFTDVANDGFCSFVLEVFYLGITTGTTPTTYDPSSAVTRLQMAAFLSRTVDGVLKRSGRRAALEQNWIPRAELSLGLTPLAGSPFHVKCDGEDVWVALAGGVDQISRVHASDGKLLATWTGAVNPSGVLVATGHVFATGNAVNRLYRIDPSQPPGVVETVATNLGTFPHALAFDGIRLWSMNNTSVSIVTPAAAAPWPVTTVSAGLATPGGGVYDGSNIWITDQTANTLLKLDAGGSILQTVTVGANPAIPVFDGTNIWVPNYAASSVSVVRASSGAVLSTLTGNGLNGPAVAAFDGQRVLVTNYFSGANSVSLWKAADFTGLGFFPMGAGTQPFGATSDGVSFFITLTGTNKLARF